MTRTAGRLTVALLLAVFILLALLLRTQGSASASAPAQLAPPDQREALGLRVLQGFTYADVAAALECSETHARRRVLDALGRVRGMME